MVRILVLDGDIMSKSKLTTHSKVRYTERIGYREDVKTKLNLAKKYGVRINDIPVEYYKQRKLIGYKKIYYDGIMFVFSANNYHNVVTVYPYHDKVLQRLYDIKRNNIVKESKNPIKYKQTYFCVDEQKYSIVMNGFKIVELKTMELCPDYIYPNYGDYKPLIRIIESIRKFLSGKSVSIFGC